MPNSGPSGKHVEAERLFQIANLSRIEIVVEDDDVRIVMPDESLQLFHLPLSEVRGYVGRFAPLGKPAGDFGAGCLGKASNLVERIVPFDIAGQQHPHDDRLFTDDALKSFSFCHLLRDAPG